MKTVLIISPQFVPSSAPQVHRVRFLANYLEEFGWRPTVLTIDHRFLEEAPDWEFAKSVPPSLEVIRTKAFSAKWTRLIGVGDVGIRSYFHLRHVAEKLCRERSFDLVFISSPPWHTFLIGPWLKKRFRVPYVLDFTDPWVSAMGEGAPFWKKSHWFRKMAIWLEPSAVKNADSIVSVSEGTNEGIRKRYPGLLPPFGSIPIGGERKDFEHARNHPAPNRFFDRNDGLFHFVYLGAMLPKAYDALRAFFAALKRLREKKAELFNRLRFHFIGTTYAVNPRRGLVWPVAEEEGLEAVVKEHPARVPYFEALSLLMGSQAILALGSTEAHYTASKIFPCLLAEKPLVAIYYEKSSVVQVMKDARGGELVTFGDAGPSSVVPAIEAALLKVTSPDYRQPSLDWKGFEKYSARSMAQKMAQVFENVHA